MTKGLSLEQDLRLLINNPKYSDIEILCEDEKKLYACRTILSARSVVFYSGLKKTYENQISFPQINSAGMEIILEYIYTGSLSDLQDFIMKTIKSTNFVKDYSPELLSKVLEIKIMPLTENIISILNLLVETVANIQLNSIEFGRLSITGLKYLLSIAYENETRFATQEYEVFRYSAILAAKQVSDDVCRNLMERLPTLEQIENSIEVENKPLIDHQKVTKELEPLVKYIDFKRIKTHILANFIEPLGIIPTEIVRSAYRNIELLSNFSLSDFRGKAINDYVWDETACGSKLIIKDNGKIVQTIKVSSYRHQSVRAKITLGNRGIFEWDVIIEKACSYSWVGICASENFNYENPAENQSTVWVLGSCGYVCNSGISIDYCSPFGDGTKITVHLDMNKRTCSFTINGTKYREVSEWNLPSKLHPVVVLRYPGRFQIQAQKLQFI
ncbi:10488_t:CDS:2 [Rhizophagus irregularis]|nr:10488_t:CDS:2 [Rhizophagus irregularis]